MPKGEWRLCWCKPSHRVHSGSVCHHCSLNVDWSSLTHIAPVREYAEEVDAQLLLEKIDEYRRENDAALEEVVEWTTPPDSPTLE